MLFIASYKKIVTNNELKIPNVINNDRSLLNPSEDNKNNGTAPIPSSQIIYNQAILDGIAKSSDLGREIEIEIPEI